jgi:predicted acylesterase/phospholipase RssA
LDACLNNLIGILLICFVSGVGCSSVHHRTQSKDPFSLPSTTENSGSPAETVGGTASLEVFGPPNEAAAEYGPNPLKIRPVVLVLGPGLAKSFAESGVLQVLHEHKIPIGAIFGTEMGAVMGAFYACSTSIHQFEWRLLQFKWALLERKVSSALEATFYKYLQHIFGDMDLDACRIPLFIGLGEVGSTHTFTVGHGRIVDVLRASLRGRLFEGSSPWMEGPRSLEVTSGAQQKPYLVEDALALHMGPVVVVDVLQQEMTASGLDLLKQADVVIRPNVKKVDLFDFSKKTQTVFRGKEATLKYLSELRRWVGI